MALSPVVGRRCAPFAAGVMVVALASAPARAAFTAFTDGGDATTASIQSTVDAFRAALGDPVNGNAAGPLSSGRREINWDGGGATTAAISGSPLTAFTNTRGGTFSTPGTGFLQTPLTDVALTGIQGSYATTFAAFSAQRIFTPTGSNIVDVTFSLPGTAGATAATVAGFGAVFSDVDEVGGTMIEFFDLANASLYAVTVPQSSVGANSNGTLSFAGAVANAGEKIARVRITLPDPLGAPDGEPVDVVVMDDFFYSEPIAVPEPAHAAAAAGLAAGAAYARRRRRR